MRCCIHLSSSVTSLMAGLPSPFFLMHLNASSVNAWLSTLLPWLSTTSSTICNMQIFSIDKAKQSTKFIYPRNISTGWWPVKTSTNSTPKPYTSHFSVTRSVSRYSGYMYRMVLSMELAWEKSSPGAIETKNQNLIV